MVYRSITMIRGILISAIFKHTLQLDHITAEKSAAVTLMSTDVDNIEAGFVMMHDLWAGVLELGIGLYLLSRYVGAAAVFTLAPALCKSTWRKVIVLIILLTMSVSTASSHYLSMRTGPALKAWNQAVLCRIAWLIQIRCCVKLHRLR